MFGKNQSSDIADEDMDDDDVDVYVSPRRFVGRTPGPKATKQKIFEEDNAENNAAKGKPPDNSIALGIENVKYNVGPREYDENNDHTHTSIRRNTILSLVCFAVNYALVFICIYMLAVSIWTLFAQRNGGLRAFVASEGVGLRSPIALGLCLLIASISGIVNAIVLGVGEVAPSIVEGLQVDGRRKAFVMHQVLSTIALVLFSLVLMSTIPPLSQLTHSGVTATTWRDMATSYPRGICEFQISHQCAGFMNFMCASDTASTSVACPGHYCSSECRISPRHTVSNSSECRACVLFTNSPLLLRCKTNEDRRSSSYSCRLPLRRVVRRFFLVIIVSTSIALIWSLIVVLSSILSPLLST